MEVTRFPPRFDCDAYPNPIQVFKADGQTTPYNVSELDLETGRYNKICSFPTTENVNGFALMQYPAGKDSALTDKVYSFVCSGRKLERFDCSGVTRIPGTLLAHRSPSADP